MQKNDDMKENEVGTKSILLSSKKKRTLYDGQLTARREERERKK
jgi:hypothetical protein